MGFLRWLAGLDRTEVLTVELSHEHADAIMALGSAHRSLQDTIKEIARIRAEATLLAQGAEEENNGRK